MTDDPTRVARQIVEDYVAEFNTRANQIVRETVERATGAVDTTLAALRASHEREHDLVGKLILMAGHIGEHPEMSAEDIAEWLLTVLYTHLEQSLMKEQERQ